MALTWRLRRPVKEQREKLRKSRRDFRINTGWTTSLHFNLLAHRRKRERKREEPEESGRRCERCFNPEIVKTLKVLQQNQVKGVETTGRKLKVCGRTGRDHTLHASSILVTGSCWRGKK